MNLLLGLIFKKYNDSESTHATHFLKNNDYESTHMRLIFLKTTTLNRLLRLIFKKAIMNRLRRYLTRIGPTSATASYGYVLK